MLDLIAQVDHHSATTAFTREAVPAGLMLAEALVDRLHVFELRLQKVELAAKVLFLSFEVLKNIT